MKQTERPNPGWIARVGLQAAAVALSALTGMMAVDAALRPLAVVIVAALLVLIVWGEARRAARLRGLEETAGRLAAWTLRDDSEPVAGVEPPGRDDEFAVLARQLDEVARRLVLQVREAAKKNRNLEALIDAMDEPVLATDNDDQVQLCNRAAEAMLGAEPGGLIGRGITELFTQAEVLEMHGAARRGETRRGRTRAVTKLGARTMQVSAAPVPVAWGEGVFGAVLVLRDVTELAQSLQVKTDFVANASHELRTPVAAIRGAAETLQETVHEDAAMADRLVGMILSHTTRLEEMLRDLLDLSRLESPDVPVKSEPVDLSDVERSLRAQLEASAAARRLTLGFDFDEELVGMRTDPALLMLVLRNLLENAIKFAREQTTIHIRGSLVEETIRTQHQSGAAGGGPAEKRGVARFEVEDHGVGIPMQHQDRVFERYYQVDPARTGVTGAKRGTGLGLAIVKHAAKSLRGGVGLTSVWGSGTRVWAEWPVTISRQGPG